MGTESETECVAECLWPGVTAALLCDLEERVRHECSWLGRPAQYLGSILIPQDEVVFCIFRGRLEEVRQAAQAAGVPYDRLLDRSSP